MEKTIISIDKRCFSVSNLDKIFWPEGGYTKGDLIKYYVEIAPYIIHHLNDRPVVFTRYPEGINGKHFYQKNAPPHLPKWIETFTYYSNDSERNIDYIMIKERAVLGWLANQACIEMHPWLSKPDNIDCPDFVTIDLDPSPGNSYLQIIDIALLLKNLFDELGLNSYPKTSGSKGLHIYIPINNDYTYTQVRSFAREVASLITEIRSDISTIERSVNKRGPKIYIDYLQNVRGKTLCSPYSVRARYGATVSAPLKWKEVPSSSPADFDIKTMISRVKEQGDLFAPVLDDKQSLHQASEKLGLHLPVR